MTQSDKELLIKDLCTRLPYGVMCHANEINLDGELFFINKAYNIVSLCNYKASGEFDICPIADIKPYLRPMSSMTEEEVKEFAALESIDVLGGDIKITIVELSVDAIDWLNKKMFDYRGLIEKGLALEAKEGMYKTE